MRCVSFFLFFSLFLLQRISAQSLFQNPGPLYTNNLTVEKGLSQSNANAIVKDRDGFIWIATDDGLNRFDGNSFKIFVNDPEVPTSISNDQVKSLLLDSKGTLWAGTVLGGLNRYNRRDESFDRMLHNPSDSNTISNNSVISLIEDDNNNLWIGTYFGLNRYDPETGKVTRYLTKLDSSGIISNAIYSLMKDHRNRIWVGTENGFSIIDPQRDKVINFERDLEGKRFGRVVCFYQDNRNRVWLGTYGQGLYCVSNRERSMVQFVHQPLNAASISSNVIRKIISEDNNHLFVGTDGAGINVLDLQSNMFKRLFSKNDASFNNAAVYDLYLDSQQILWIGTYGAGVKQVNKSRKGFIHYETFDDFMGKVGKNSVLCLAEDHNRNIWIGTDGSGLYKFDPLSRTFTNFRHDPLNEKSISGNVVKSLLVDTTGNIYAGTFAAGLNYLDQQRGTFERFQYDPADVNSLRHNSVWSLHQDRDGRIWVGTLGGLNEFVPEEKRFIYHERNFEEGDGAIVAFLIHEDRKGDIWFGTRDNGLFRYSKREGRFQRYVHERSGLNSSEIRDIYEESSGKMWVATMGGGLNIYDPDADRFVPLKVSSPNDVVSMLKDKEGNFWLGTFRGLVKFDPEHGTQTIYDATDGLQGSEFNYGARLVSQGQFYFGGLNGLTVFKPHNIKPSEYRPPLLFTRLMLFHKEVAIGDESGILFENLNLQKELTFKPDQNVITIEFAAADYCFPRKNNYAFKMEGFDEDWNYVGKRSAATYTNLPPGNYVFKVKATNTDGVWGANERELHITVSYPWYQLRWLQLVALTLIGTTIVVVSRLRTGRLERQKAQLTLLVQERTWEIEQQKAVIEQKNRALEETNAKIIASHEKIVQQNEELLVRHEEISAQNEEISRQQIEIENKSRLLERAHADLKQANDDLISINGNLEKLVESRTGDLREALKRVIETDKDLDTFLYRSSHDLRGPITSLMGLAQLARSENHQPGLNPYFDKINLTCAHMLRLLRKLNDVNFVLRSKSHLAKVDWNKILDEVLFELDKIDPHKHVSVSIDNRVPDHFVGDEQLLLVIIQNLMENAVIFRIGPHPHVRLSMYILDTHMHIEVLDNGIGIKEEVRDKIFEMFYRGSERSVGNGLGLFLVKKATELLDGELNIESRPGFTRFRVSVPVA